MYLSRMFVSGITAGKGLIKDIFLRTFTGRDTGDPIQRMIKMAVYVGDNMHGALMIKKVGSQWHVHRLKQVKAKHRSFGHMSSQDKYKLTWEWEKAPSAKHGYKPYDDDDVTRSPDPLFPHVQRMAQHKVSKSFW
jgi:hypothetical protein